MRLKKVKKARRRSGRSGVVHETGERSAGNTVRSHLPTCPFLRPPLSTRITLSANLIRTRSVRPFPCSSCAGCCCGGRRTAKEKDVPASALPSTPLQSQGRQSQVLKGDERKRERGEREKERESAREREREGKSACVCAGRVSGPRGRLGRRRPAATRHLPP